MRIDNLEFRTLPNRPPEIIFWDKDRNGNEYCYTLAFYYSNNEGYYVQFVGDRPFKLDGYDVFWHILQYGQSVLDAKFMLEYNTLSNLN